MNVTEFIWMYIAVQIYAMFLFVCKKCIWPYQCFFLFFFLASWAVLLEEKKELGNKPGFSDSLVYLDEIWLFRSKNCEDLFESILHYILKLLLSKS